MGERKVLNKYFPPDFDPSTIPRKRQPKNQQIKVRTMLSMTIRCNSCGHYIYKGTKFNSRKEKVSGEKYLGIQIFRFYIKCTKCSAEITIKTDLQNSDYVVESGASRNFEPWRAEDEETAQKKRKRDAEEMGDSMKSLENKTLDSKRKMDNSARLDELKSMKSRQAIVSVDAMLETVKRSAEEKEKKLEEKDEALIKSVFLGNQIHTDLKRRRKLSEELPVNQTDFLRKTTKHGYPGDSGVVRDGKFIFKSSSVTVSVVGRPSIAKTSVTSTGLESLCQNYPEDD